MTGQGRTGRPGGSGYSGRRVGSVPAPRVDDAVSVAIADRVDGPVYPVPDIEPDRRFSYALLADIERVLIQHGYPALGLLHDATDLQKAVYDFLYSTSFAYRPWRSKPAPDTGTGTGAGAGRGTAPGPVAGVVDGPGLREVA